MTLSLARIPQPDSPLSRLDARWKLAGLMAAAGAVAGLHTWQPSLTALIIALALVVLSRLPARWVLMRLGTVAGVVFLFAAALPFLLTGPEPPLAAWGPLEVSAPGLDAAATLIAKSTALVSLTLVLLGTAPLDVTLKAAHRLHIPGLLIQLVILTHRYIDVTTAEMGQMRIALRTRGFRNRATRHAYRTIGHVAGTLLVRGAERAERVGQAMRCRGFDGQFHSLIEFRTTAKDVLVFLLLVTMFVGLLAWDRLPAWGVLLP